MRLFAIIFCSMLAAAGRAEVRLANWEEFRDEKTGEQRVMFFLSPDWVLRYWEAHERGDAKGAIGALKGRKVEEIWSYALQLRGNARRYEKAQLFLFEPSPCGGPLELVSGSVELDRDTGIVRVSLQVKQEGKLGAFIANGVYRIPKPPNKAPEPTP